ncbi:hypothetical protein M440DRAFT_1228140 [Trichoderma longibrachiatum ATCC 18648]|uniref:Uncharacterized protein n=1 Tax=Trichoderma longibrachiatum ATCC 18648 TaxID=983965 RepID=A0A2T4C8M7_TRILO|nr:hypothetical protein M440DRAFT_1228140 [Trichoderma longibrachiatum ATCC 18648]
MSCSKTPVTYSIMMTYAFFSIHFFFFSFFSPFLFLPPSLSPSVAYFVIPYFLPRGWRWRTLRWSQTFKLCFKEEESYLSTTSRASFLPHLHRSEFRFNLFFFFFFLVHFFSFAPT